jgi:hypothetical protein
MGDQAHPPQEQMLDGNAAAGVLQGIFGVEMTACPTECEHCGREGELGSLLAFAPATGWVLRCPACQGVILRVVETTDYVYLDARGAVYLKIARPAA